MKKINLYGAPSSGKSTLARELTNAIGYKYKLKTEQITEVAKDKVYEGNDMKNAPKKLRLKIFPEQFWKEASVMSHKPDFLITDSPLLMCGFYYNQSDYVKHVRFETEKLDEGFDEVYNFYLLSHDSHQDFGRSHSQSDSQIITNLMQDFLSDNGVTPIILQTKSLEDRVNEVIKYLGI